MHRLIAIVIFLASAGLQAAPITIDFEEFNVGDSGGDAFNPLESKGFVFDYGGIDQTASIEIGDNGTKVFNRYVEGFGQDGFGYGTRLQVERIDGGAFALHAFDFIADTDAAGWSQVRGFTMDNTTIFLDTTPLDSSEWLNLRSVTFQAEGNTLGPGYADIQLDNIVVSAVPIPAAVWLFGSALAGLGWLRRKQLT